MLNSSWHWYFWLGYDEVKDIYDAEGIDELSDVGDLTENFTFDQSIHVKIWSQENGN